MTVYDIERTSQFKRDYKLAKKRGHDTSLLLKAIAILASGRQLPEKYDDHALSSNWAGHRECHIKGDWLLVYRVFEEEKVVSLVRTGSHSDIF
jgi:mRNA interferase YafQ